MKFKIYATTAIMDFSKSKYFEKLKSSINIEIEYPYGYEDETDCYIELLDFNDIKKIQKIINCNRFVIDFKDKYIEIYDTYRE